MASHGYMDKISDVPVFKKLDSDLRKRISDIMFDISEVTNLSTGEVLYEEGSEDANTGAVLVGGSLEVQNEQGANFEINAPELVGEMQQFNDYGQRTATVKAKTNAAVLQFSWHELVQRLREAPTISQEDRLELKEVLTDFVGERLKKLAD